MATFTDRAFGIEIEFVGVDLRTAAAAIRAKGVPCEREGYNHITRNHWKIVTDASLRSEGGHAGELVSPILRGAQGLRELELALEALNEEGAQVNVSCGLHVHLDCRDMTMTEIATVYDRYSSYEQQIDSVMPRSRRGNARWCRSIIGQADQIKQCRTKEDGQYSFGRYYKINLRNIATRGSMEFRQHSGTTDYTKITNWLSFLMQFVERSRMIASAGPTEAPVFRPRKSRAFDHARRIAEHFGVEVSWAGRSYGFRQSWDRHRRVSVAELEAHYTGEGHDTLNVQEWMHTLGRWGFLPTVEGVQDDSWFDGIDADVQRYLTERQQELA